MFVYALRMYRADGN